MKKLFDKVTFKDIELKNRFFRSGTWISKANEDGTLTKDFFEYYKNLAEAELGFVTLGYARVCEEDKANNGMTGLWDDKFIPDLKIVTDEFHKHNTFVAIQLAMGGTQVHYTGDITWKLLAPSKTELHPRLDSYGNKAVYTANEITKAEIDTVINKFAEAALRVKQAGFDMVQLHCGHGYFLSSWMNPEVNVREDEYGGSTENRARFLIELYEAVRTKVGNDFKVGVKINSEEHESDFSNHNDMLYLCSELDKRGIDLIEVSGNNPSRTKVTLETESYYKEFAKKLKKEVNAIIVLTGGNKTFNNLEKMLNETDIDLIGLSRPLIAEIDLVKKWQKDSGHKAKCISCNYCHKVVNTCVFNK